MKTKLCRPVLVESKELPNIGDIVKSKFNDIHILTKNDTKSYIKTITKQQLILISLDPDEKIEVGDTLIDIRDNKLFKIERILTNHYESGVMSYQKSYCRKVIATQSQLSPEYIQQFIEEYNKGEVKDVEIEMEETKEVASYTFDGSNDGELIWKFKPKLTNGFITIVEEKIFTSLKPREDTHSLLLNYHEWYLKWRGQVSNSTPNFAVEEYLKLVKPILYTEEEVKTILNKILSIDCSFIKEDGSHCIIVEDEAYTFDEWFEQNKKK